MKINSAIKEGHNNLLIQLDGTQSYIGIRTIEGDLLRISRSQGVNEFSYKGTPGRYQIDTDGEIKDVQSTKIKETRVIEIKILSYRPQSNNVFLITINEQLQEMTADELIKNAIRFNESEFKKIRIVSG